VSRSVRYDTARTRQKRRIEMLAFVLHPLPPVSGYSCCNGPFVPGNHSPLSTGLYGISLGGWIGYLIAGFLGPCILIAVARAIKR
jgi:hypothetical protein